MRAAQTHRQHLLRADCPTTTSVCSFLLPIGSTQRMLVHCSGTCLLVTRPGTYLGGPSHSSTCFLTLPGLAVGLGIGALAEVAKKSLRSENSTGEQGPVYKGWMIM